MCILWDNYEGFSPTLVVKGGLDQYIRPLKSIIIILALILLREARTKA
jgi:hypothetical protein